MAVLQVKSNMPGAVTLTLLNGTEDTGYKLLSDAEWGNAVWDIAYSGPRGTQGARATSAVPANRPVILPFRVTGTSKDNLAARLSDLAEVADELRRFGGRITWQSNNQSYRQHFEVLSGSAAVREWGNRAESALRTVVMLEASCAPYLVGDPLDISDDFSTDTLDDDYYTVDTGTGTIAVSGGQLVPSTTATKRLRHTGRGYTHKDGQVTIEFTTGTMASGFALSAIAKAATDGTATYLYAMIDHNSIEVGKMVAGTPTEFSSTAVTPASNTKYWLRFRIEGNALTGELFTVEPTPMGTPTNNVVHTLSDADASAFAAAGHAGLDWALNATDHRIDSFRWEPFTYRNRTLPEEIQLGGSIPGDAPALMDLTVTPSGGSAAPIWAGLGWSKRPEIHNLVWNGDFEEDVNGWSVALVAGVTGAATSIARVTTSSKYGVAAAQVVTPATAWTGASFVIRRRFRKGVLYTAVVWARAASATTTARVRLGDPTYGDVAPASGGDVALSTTWTAHTVTWTPLIDTDLAYVAFEVTQAIATTMMIDGVQVYEGDAAPAVGKHAEGKGGYPPLGILAAEACDTGDLSNWAVTADANARGGYQLEYTTSGAGTASATWFVDPHLLVPDDFTQGELSVMVFARIEADGDLVSPKLTLSAIPEAGVSYGTERYAAPHESAGKLIVENSGTGTVFRTVCLGTLRFFIDRGRPARWKVKVTASFAASSAGQFNLDYLWLVPSNAFAYSPTGKANDSGFPKFAAATSEISRTILSDLRGLTAKPPGYQHPDHGLGGSLLELPSGDVDLALKLSSLVPDDPTSDTTTEQLAHAATVHAAVTPRWHILRDS